MTRRGAVVLLCAVALTVGWAIGCIATIRWAIR